MLLKNKIEELKRKGFVKERYNQILLLKARGFSVRDIKNITGLNRTTINKYLLYYEYSFRSYDYVRVNSKQEPYYKDEMQYSSIPTYNYDELSESEKEFYIDNLKLNN